MSRACPLRRSATLPLLFCLLALQACDTFLVPHVQPRMAGRSCVLRGSSSVLVARVGGGAGELRAERKRFLCLRPAREVASAGRREPRGLQMKAEVAEVAEVGAGGKGNKTSERRRDAREVLDELAAAMASETTSMEVLAEQLLGASETGE
eukprot:24838-Hanusia_phi.AAC.3